MDVEFRRHAEGGTDLNVDRFRERGGLPSTRGLEALQLMERL